MPSAAAVANADAAWVGMAWMRSGQSDSGVAASVAAISWGVPTLMIAPITEPLRAQDGVTLCRIQRLPCRLGLQAADRRSAGSLEAGHLLLDCGPERIGERVDDRGHRVRVREQETAGVDRLERSCRLRVDVQVGRLLKQLVGKIPFLTPGRGTGCGPLPGLGQPTSSSLASDDRNELGVACLHLEVADPLGVGGGGSGASPPAAAARFSSETRTSFGSSHVVLAMGVVPEVLRELPHDQLLVDRDDDRLGFEVHAAEAVLGEPLGDDRRCRCASPRPRRRR